MRLSEPYNPLDFMVLELYSPLDSIPGHRWLRDKIIALGKISKALVIKF